MGILKRDGGEETFSINKLMDSLIFAGVPDPKEIAYKVLDAKSTQEIADRVQLLMLNRVTEDLRWHDIARNYLLWSVYKQVWGKGTVNFYSL